MRDRDSLSGRLRASLCQIAGVSEGSDEFAYFTGWRVRSEILRIRWPQVDLDAGTVRLEVNTTKNKNGRLIYIPTELRHYYRPLKPRHWSRIP